jgi:hypothetical protein
MIYLTAVHDIRAGSSFDVTMRFPRPYALLPTWGITELSQTTFNRIVENDYVLFYNQGNIIGVGLVKETFINKELSAKLWGTYEHRLKGTLYWSSIILFEEYQDIMMPFNQIIGLGAYDPKFSVRRIIPLNGIGASAIERLYNGEQGYVSHICKAFSTKPQTLNPK